MDVTKPSHPSRRLLGASLAIALLAAIGPADLIAAPTSLSDFVIHGPEETLRDFCLEEEGRMWFVTPEGARHELITSTSDPSIANPGDGLFHPFSESVVRAALVSVRYRLEGVGAEVFLLPYPRRLGHSSAAGRGIILLAPGVRPLSEEQQHATLAHELGHIVHHALMPDQRTELWTRYRVLRGIADEARFHPAAPHADRPHEIFAEDFRALFGGNLATYSGTIENASLTPPSHVQGLDAFLASLAGGLVADGDALLGFPNPSRGAMSFRRAGGEADPLDLYDLAGRKLATLNPTPLAHGWHWRWDGRDERGVPASPGVVFARLRGGVGPAAQFSVVR
jgi:hypothetical protein